MDINNIANLSTILRKYVNSQSNHMGSHIVKDINEKLSLIYKDLGKEYPVTIRHIKISQKQLFRNNDINSSVNRVAATNILIILNVLYETEKNKMKNIWSFIHPQIIKSSKKLYMDGHYSNAALDAFIEISDRMKKIYTYLNSENKDVPDGTDLMHKILSENSSALKLGDLNTKKGKDIQRGFSFMFSGAISALRNPSAHSNDEKLTAEESMRRLMFASMLMYKIDEAVKNNKIQEKE